MRPAAALLSSSLVSHTSSSRSLPGILIASLFLPVSVLAQNDTSASITKVVKEVTDSTVEQPVPIRPISAIIPPADYNYYQLTPEQKKKRIRLVAAGNIIGYSGTMVALYSAWYKNYPQTGLHSFNDFPEWKQADKAGHLYSAYIESRLSMELWRWTGIDRKKRIWIGGMSGAAYQTVIEVLDGFSEGWGWSWTDFSANILGSGLLVAQELAWNDQRIKLKFSFHRKIYHDAELNSRSNSLFGKSTAERLLKDYNGQTYWASANIRSFFPKAKVPGWLSIAVGYGAEGMFGGRENIGKDDNGTIIFNRTDIKRYRQWYFAPDIDLTKIKTNKKGIKFLLTVLSAFKFPSPALQFSNGKLKGYFLYF